MVRRVSVYFKPFNFVSCFISDNLTCSSMYFQIWTVFEKGAIGSRHDRSRASGTPTLGTGLRPLMSDVTHCPGDLLSHRTSSIAEAVDNQVDELSRKVESMTMRVSELERQLSSLEKRFYSYSTK